MSPERESELMDLDDVERICWWGAGISWVIFFTALAGEVFGWWNDAGEIAISVTGVLGSLLAVIALLVAATKGQVRAATEGVTDNGRRLGLIHHQLIDVGGDVEPLHGDMGTLHDDMGDVKGLLVEIRDRL